MGRLLLFLVAAAACGGVLLNPGLRGARTHTKSQQQALVRQTLDDGVATVLDAAIDPARRSWLTANPLGSEFTVGGNRIAVEDYHLEDTGTVVVFTLAAYRGGVAQRRTSRYRIPNSGWPGPLWVDSPYAVSRVDEDATINGGGRLSYFDATRFEAFRLGSVLSRTELADDLGDGIHEASGTGAPLSVVDGMDAVRQQFGAPRPIELVGRAMSEFRAGDTRLVGNTTVTNNRNYGAWPATTTTDARIVHVTGDLTIASGGRIRGNGLLLVDGDLVVDGRLEWTGLVVVRTPQQHVKVDFESGKVDIRGGLVVDQEAPPPGGHTDLTVNRDLTGAWTGATSQAGAIGETGPGTPGDPEYGRTAAAFGLRGLFYDHEHRFDFRTPEVRKVYFAERTGTGGRPADRHEVYTSFRRTLNDFARAYPGERLYVRFENTYGHGSALFTLTTTAGSYYGAVATGFGAAARPGDASASPSFRPAELNDLVVDVQSLRMLTRLSDGQVPASPFWPYGTSACPSRPLCIGYLNDRDGALAVQLVRDADDRPVYEGSVYWHTHQPGSTEALEEAAADDAWRTAIRNGTEYGTALLLGKQTVLSFADAHVAGITGRLRFNQMAIEHVGSVVQYFEPPR